uniref:Tripartite motif containing 35-30 n=1 Tax=Cyprinus carpio TaxID=7962 RepID=A0A8C2G1I2_CYPCA
MSPVEVWVGPWRPHRPRGPIAAMYNSPGPTYALPGATGMNNHDPRMQKGPAFSFGTRHRGLQANSSPGPGYLVPSNITRVGRDGTPAYSVYGRPKDIQPFQTPGPGRFPQIHTATLQEQVHFLSLLGSRVVNKASAPNVSFSGRSAIGSFHEDLRKTPGPGTYQVVDSCVYKHKAPEYSITGRNFTPGDITKKPGPGAHHPERVTFTVSKAPSYSFGIRHSEYIAPIIVDGAD